MSIKDLTLQLILKYLKDNAYIESFLNLQVEGKINYQQYPKQIQFLKKILLKGHFNQAIQFIWTFQQKIPNNTLKQLTLTIYKQKLYQLLENPNQIELRNLFQKEIIKVCSDDQYQTLFTLLTCRSVKQIPGMDTWTVIKGRYFCFQQIQPYLQNFFNTIEYQKSINKFPDFNLKEIIQSYLFSLSQKNQQQLNKQKITSQNKHSNLETQSKQSKQSIQSKSSKQKYDNPLPQHKTDKFQDNEQSDKNLHQSLKQNITQNKNKSIHSINKSQLTYQQNKKNINYQDLQPIQNHKIQKIDKDPINHQQSNQYHHNQNNSTFTKKYNPYLVDHNHSNISNRSKNQNKNINYSAYPISKTQNIEQSQKMANHSYKQIRDKERDKDKDKEKYKDKDKDKSNERDFIKKPINLPQPYLKQLDKQANDSEIYQQQPRKNTTYLDQNNSSVVYKQDQNQNFTFSIGAEDSGNYQKNRRILKLTSLTDPKAIRTCQFSPSGTYFAFGTNSSYLKIYDIQQLFETNQQKQLQPICTIQKLHTKSIFCLDWSSTNKSIITCSNDLTIKITQFLDSIHQNNYQTNVIGRHQSCIRMIKFNSLQKKIISCGDDSLIKIWDIGKIKKCITLKGHTQSIPAFKFAHQKQDNIIYSVSKDCTIKKWDLRVDQCVTSSSVQQSQLTFISSHTDRIAVSHKNGYISYFTQQLQMQYSIQIHDQQIRSIDSTTYDDLFLTASFDGNISLFTQKNSQTPSYHQHNQNQQDKVVFATFLNHPQHRGFASTSTLGICNIFSYQ